MPGRGPTMWRTAGCCGGTDSEVTQPTISHHLGILRRTRLAPAQREGQQVYYTANRYCLEACTRRLVDRLGVTFPGRDD